MLVVGLGNPGSSYARTRHNIGAVLVERLAERLGANLARARGQARSADVRLGDASVVLAVPTTYMNLSGGPVSRLARKAGVRPDRLLIVHDELDLPFGRVRLKAGGGTAGHNGLRSVEASLRSRGFLRLRIGIGRPPPGLDPAEFVLKPFMPEEREPISEAVDRGIAAIETLVAQGLDVAQRELHSTG